MRSLMLPVDPAEITRYLRQMEEGDPDAVGRLLPHVYSDLRKLAGQIFQDQFRNHTLQPTALVHEAYVRLVKGQAGGWESRRHFMAVAGIAMRQLLRDYARSRSAQKRSGPGTRVELEEVEQLSQEGTGIDLIALDAALDELREMDERVARVVELRFLAGLTADETAEVLSVSKRTVFLDWSMAKAWLARNLAGDSSEQES
ncbi:MAG: sigma-70 family RNA polymerase sigma factor [Proteobacteria bacterium]|nr:sigma-70 family RNA polymerase sigma factor [Pseudomonadota bacterium]